VKNNVLVVEGRTGKEREQETEDEELKRENEELIARDII
jgi:hypothetical protein